MWTKEAAALPPFLTALCTRTTIVTPSPMNSSPDNLISSQALALSAVDRPARAVFVPSLLGFRRQTLPTASRGERHLSRLCRPAFPGQRLGE